MKARLAECGWREQLKEHCKGRNACVLDDLDAVALCKPKKQNRTVGQKDMRGEVNRKCGKQTEDYTNQLQLLLLAAVSLMSSVMFAVIHTTFMLGMCFVR